MDCNKEEALKAKQIAEKKMENKDFSGALKIATKAQQLYPQLENISQIILVCEVHCSSEKKVYGNDKDWYGILKIDPSADDLSIKKQYRKLALVLHPDKNKFSGSADAFKIIGEAQTVLLDREKRIVHDSKRRAFGNTFSRQTNVHHHRPPWNHAQGHSGNFTGGRSGNFPFPQQRAQTGVSGIRPTFWTVCPFCSVRYQFYRDDVINKSIHCQSCKKSFTAYELNVQAAASAAAPGMNQTRQSPLNVPFRGAEGQNRNFTTTPVFGGDNSRRKEPPKPQNTNRKRKKKVQESSESSDSDSNSSESEEDEQETSESSDKNGEKHQTNPDFQQFGEQPRRSSRQKRNVSYKENVNENENDNEDDATPSNKSKKKVTSEHTSEPKVEEDTFWKEEVTKTEMETETETEERKNENEPEVEETEEEPEVYECPDPEFSDFDKERKKESFNAGQIWAVYDNDDAMPRFYAFIKKVLSPGFKVQITWLEPVPENDQESKWVNKDLPVSCGKFKRGKTDKAEDLPMFSHLVSWESLKTGFNIVPRKGETWALFKNWSINWSTSTENKTRKYEYEFVEILSDYNDDEGVRVWFLEKVKGFTCIFKRKDDVEMIIRASEKLRFSHMVPSCRMSGEERERVPKGSYELDPAGLPASTFE